MGVMGSSHVEHTGRLRPADPRGPHDLSPSKRTQSSQILRPCGTRAPGAQDATSGTASLSECKLLMWDACAAGLDPEDYQETSEIQGGPREGAHGEGEGQGGGSCTCRQGCKSVIKPRA